LLYFGFVGHCVFHRAKNTLVSAISLQKRVFFYLLQLSQGVAYRSGNSRDTALVVQTFIPYLSGYLKIWSLLYEFTIG
jgi:hypothetical protein